MQKSVSEGIDGYMNGCSAWLLSLPVHNALPVHISIPMPCRTREGDPLQSLTNTTLKSCISGALMKLYSFPDIRIIGMPNQ